MKFRRLSAAALLAVLGVATVAPVAAGASSTPVTSVVNSGTVTIGEGVIDPDTDPIVDPEDPEGSIDPTDPDIEKPEGPAGSISMTGASKLVFGDIAISTTEQSSYAAAYVGNNMETPAVEITRGNFVSWTDLRGADAGDYTITAQMTQQFTSGTNVLSGATIAYTNPLIATRPDAVSGDTTGGVDISGANSLTLGVDTTTNVGNTVTVATAAAGSGSGAYTLEFGQALTATDTSATSVELTIPQATAATMVQGDYIANITWSINYTA